MYRVLSFAYRTLSFPEGTARNSLFDADLLDALDKWPYLDAVIREALHLHSCLVFFARMSVTDGDVLLATPACYVCDVFPRVFARHIGNAAASGVGSVKGTGYSSKRSSPAVRRNHGSPTYRGGDRSAGFAIAARRLGNSVAVLGGPRGCIGFRSALNEYVAVLLL